MNIITRLVLFSCLSALLIQLPGFSLAAEGVSQPAAPALAAPESETARLYRQHRQEFAKKKRQIEEKQKQTANDAQGLQRRIGELESSIQSKEQEINDLNGRINREEAKHIGWMSARGILASVAVPELAPTMMASGAASFLGPLAGGAMGMRVAAMLPCIAFSIIIIVVMIWAWRRHWLETTRLSKRARIAIIAAAIVLICAIASPLFAADLQTEEQTMQKLDQVSKVLAQSDYQRWIDILKNLPPGQSVNVMSLESGDPRFAVSSKVSSGSPEYWSTLAALYTHEHQPGDTLTAVDGMIIELVRSGLHSDARVQMALNSVNYLLEKQETQRVTNAVDKLVPNIGDTGVLLKLATELEKGGQQSSAQKALDQAVARANSVEALCKLARYFINANKLDKAGETLAKAVSHCDTVEKFTDLITVALEAKNDGVVKNSIEAFKKNFFPVDKQMAFVDFLLKNNRREDAIAIFTNVVNFSNKNEQTLLFLIDEALKRDLLDEALNATYSLYGLVNGSKGDGVMAYGIPFAGSLHEAASLPDPTNIMLPEFYGLLYEKKGLNDRAEQTYTIYLLNSLERIVKSHGYDLPQTPNGCYLIGEVWAKNNKEELLKRLDVVYQAIERQILKKMEQGKQDDGRLQPLREKRQQLQQRVDELQRLSMEKERALSDAARKTFFQALSTIASFLFFIAATVVCLVIAWRYSRTLTSCRTFGFVFKFIEATSWLRVMSIIGIISGILGVVLAQFNQIFQQNQEHNKRAADQLVPVKPLTP